MSILAAVWGFLGWKWLLVVLAFCVGALVGARNRHSTIAAGRLVQSGAESAIQSALKRWRG